MKYTNQSFSVFAPDSTQYRANWNRIFGDRALEERILAHARKLNIELNIVIFWPLNFNHIDAEDKIIDALHALARRNYFVIEYRLSCPDGHTFRVDTSPPAEHGFEICPVCDADVDLSNDLTYDLRMQYVLRK